MCVMALFARLDRSVVKASVEFVQAEVKSPKPKPPGLPAGLHETGSIIAVPA